MTRNQHDAEVREAGVEAIGVATNVTDETSVNVLADAAWSAFGTVDVLVNNAGVMHATGPLTATSAADFDWVFAVNVRGAMNGIRAFVLRFIASSEECPRGQHGVRARTGCPTSAAGSTRPPSTPG